MGSFSDFLELKILDHIVGKTDYDKPTCYVGLSTADPLDTGAGLAEPVGDGYARVATAAGDWNAAAAGANSNANDIEFPQATGAWGTITHFALFDAAAAGNMMAHSILTTQKVIDNGDTAKFVGGTPGELVNTLD